ncbi:MAG: PilN domain-containing protein [Gemmatimonadetes bacterium]|nr:PilN domain-containing protein [Gemmatimonadota bacterium]
MIRINLVPGAAKRSKRRLPSLGSVRMSTGTPRMPSVDRWLLFAILTWIVGPLTVGWMYTETGTRLADLNVALETARMDSIRYAEMRRANEMLLARQDSIAMKLQVIQEIDAGRFSWVHIMDEISRSLPPYTWLMTVTPRPSEGSLDAPKFLLEGRAGNTFSIVEFMQELEASPFLRSITLVTTDQVREGEALIYSFTLEGEFQQPPSDMIETVPVFQGREGD